MTFVRNFWMWTKNNFLLETIYLEVLGGLSLIGIFTSSFLIFGVVKRKSGMMIGWISSQGITIVYQVFLAIDFSFCCQFKNIPNVWVTTVVISLICFLTLQIFNMCYIIRLYQEIVEEKTKFDFKNRRKSRLEVSAITLDDIMHI